MTLKMCLSRWWYHSHLLGRQACALDHHTDTDLGGILREAKVLSHAIKQCEEYDTHFEVVYLSSDRERKTGSKPLLKQRRHLARRVQLRPECRHTQVILRANRGNRIATHRGCDYLQICGHLHLFTELVPISRLEYTNWLELCRSNPLAIRACQLGKVRRRHFRLVERRPLVECLNTQR